MIRLQVSSISPATVNTGEAVMAKVFGSAFDAGATVQFIGPGGTLSADMVTVTDSNTISLQVPALTAGAYDVKVTNPDNESSTLRSGLMARGADLPCKFTVVYFDLDRSSLRSDATQTLNGAMSCIQGAAGAVKIEGNCDERGTTDYNLALGQRRANSVKTYLTKGGVPAARISTISYGEEHPADAGHTEGAWARNRRAEITTSP
jgi:peptidoglycan-associated lipoprotein